MNNPHTPRQVRGGFLLVDALLASSVLAMVLGTLVGVLLYGQAAVRAAGDRTQAVLLAEEGLEVARLLREEGGLTALAAGTFGIQREEGGQWAFVPTQDETGVFTRRVIIESTDPTRTDVTCTVSWQSETWAGGMLSVRTRFSDWQAEPAPPPEEPAL